MFNEFEILVFACMVDHCVWNIDDVLSIEDGSCLHEFPSNFGLEVDLECKRFIIYLLIIAFSLKVKIYLEKFYNIIAIFGRKE